MKRRTFDLHNGAVNRVPDIVHVAPPLVPPDNKEPPRPVRIHLADALCDAVDLTLCFDARCEEHRQDVDPKREVDVEEEYSLPVRGDERPSPSVRQRDVVDGRRDGPEDPPADPEVAKEGVLVVPKEVSEQVVLPPTPSLVPVVRPSRRLLFDAN